MKKVLFMFLLSLLLMPVYVKAATLIDNLEVERSRDTYTFSMERNSWSYTLFTDKETANIKVTPKEGVTVTGAGEVPVQEGSNRVEITATDGTKTENYVINLSVVKSTGVDADGNQINPQTGFEIPYLMIGEFLLMGGFIALISKRKFYRI